MKWPLSWRTLVTAVGAVFLLTGSAASAAPEGSDRSIWVTTHGTATGTAWDISLPKSLAGRLQDQAWLVVDGHSEGLGGGDVPPPQWKRPLRLYANINSDMDRKVKDVLKAQGFPVKPNVTVYHVSYGTSIPGAYTLPVTLHFRHAMEAVAYNNDWIPSQARYKIGDRITLFSAVAMDDSAVNMKIFDPMHKAYPNLPRDLVHRITIEVQFLPTDADGRMIKP